MTADQVRKVLLQYDAELEADGHDAENQMAVDEDVHRSLPITTTRKLPHHSIALSHTRWMCQETLKFLPGPYCPCDASDMEKAMRWLGFIQGVLWMTGNKTITQMREDNRAPGGGEG